MATSTEVPAGDGEAPHKCRCGKAFSPNNVSEFSKEGSICRISCPDDRHRMHSYPSSIRSQEINEFASGVIKKRRQQLAERGAATAGESVDEHTDLLSR